MGKTRIPLSNEEVKNLREASGEQDPLLAKGPFKTRYTNNHDDTILQSNARGPFVKTVQRLWPGSLNRSYHRSSTSYRSKVKIREQPNFYSMLSSRTTANIGATTDWDSLNSMAANWASGGSSYDALASNKARERFINECKDKASASLAVTLAEWKQSSKMIAVSAGRILGAAKALRGWDVRGLEAHLQLDIRTQQARRARKRVDDLRREREKTNSRQSAADFANLWLEYHFGWSPLVGDINSAIEVLSSNPPPAKVTSTGSYQPYTELVNKGDYAWSYNATYNVVIKMGAYVRIKNPNLALANQLGIVNPATVAWELIPFSFIVDWFIPVGKFLDSFTDLLGYDIIYPYTTTMRKASSLQIYKQPSTPLGGAAEAVYMRRDLALPPFRFVRPPFKGFSVARGATAIALVIQQFLKP